MKDKKDTFADTERLPYRETRVTPCGIRYEVVSMRPFAEAANIAMQKAVNVALKSISAATVKA